MPEPDELFHQEFVRALFDKAVQDLRAEYEDKGRPIPFTLFERYDLDPAEGVSYAQLADEFELTQTQVTNNLAQVRRRFRERALDALRGLCGSDRGVPPRGARPLRPGGRVSSRASGLSDAAVDAAARRSARWPEFESGRYSVVEEIGRGGMGTVFLAVDEELEREVAIKIPNALASASLERRLQSEARVLARLEHPGIVPIHDAGRLADGRLFYVMKRVKGRTLREQLRGVPDLTERLRLFERICEPVAFAHAAGFIHRDLKPENIMVGAFGEVMVMDWGVAKTVGSRQSSVVGHSRQSQSAVPVDSRSAVSVDSQSAVPVDSQSAVPAETGAGTVIGTVGFMAPEQARGDVGEIDERADVYGLGGDPVPPAHRRVPEADPAARLRGARSSAAARGHLRARACSRSRAPVSERDGARRRCRRVTGRTGKSMPTARPPSSGSSGSAAPIGRPSCWSWPISSCGPRWRFSPDGNADRDRSASASCTDPRPFI